MLIQEEYARRHGLSVVLAGQTLRDGIALLRSNSPSRLLGGVTHLVLHVRWVPHDRHPGRYQLFFQKPAHDSHGHRSNFSPLQDATELQYEEFDVAIRNMRRNSLPSFQAISEQRAMSLFLWEMFVCCYDGWIVRNGTTRLLSYVEASLDPLLALDDRYSNFEAAVSTIGYDNPSVFEKWQVNFGGQKKKVLPWLVKLFNGD